MSNGARERTQRTVALDQSALLEVLDALKAAEVDDRIRQAAQTIDHAFIEAEVTAVIGAAPHEPQATERESASLRRPGFAASWGTAMCTAVPGRLLTRKRSQVQTLSRPPHRL
jgi:hypothetical protein